MTLPDRFGEHLEASRTLDKSQKLLVGYSGGADSTCLLHMLHGLGYDLVAAHLHHGMRPEAELEMRLCEGFCQELGIPFISGRADVPRIAEERGMGMEEAGRSARYEFFRQAQKQFACDRVVTAHTQSDHAETVLLNLIRGTGMSGLSGIPAVRDQIVRPLLWVSRSQTRHYCDSEGLWYHDDPSNDDVGNARVRLRHLVMPQLRNINAAVDATIARCADLIAEEDQFLNGAAAAALERAELPLNGQLRFLSDDQEVAFRMDALGVLPRVLFRRAVRLAAGALGASLDHRQCDAVSGAVEAGHSGAITAEGGEVALEWDQEQLHIRRLEVDEPFRFSLTVPGETISEVFGWQITAFPVDAPLTSIRRDSLNTTVLSSSLKGSLYFRSVQAGDQMVPHGFDGRRKISDLLGESKLTQAARRRIPVVCDLMGPVWVPGVCVDARVTAPSESGPWIRLEFSEFRA